MLQVRLHGIKDGKYEIDLQTNASDILDLPEEFFGNIVVRGTLTKVGKRYSIIGNAKCSAKLICDISLNEYIEEITADFEFNFLANSELYYLSEVKGEFETESGEIIIHEDDQFLDLSEHVRQELLLNLPMKRISPEFAGKSFEDVFPNLSSDSDSNSENDEKIDERWSALKNIKFKNK